MTHATLEELPNWARALVDEAAVGHLGVIDTQGRPRVLPVTFAVTRGAVWTAVDDKPKRQTGRPLARVRWLRDRPQSAITIDRYDDDWTRLAWVQIVGATDVLDATGHDDVIAVLAGRYPHYRDRPPAGPLLRLTPERVVCWRAEDGALG